MIVGAPAIGGLVAFWGFWVLLCVGWLSRELSVKSLGIFLLLWVAGFVGLRSILYGTLFTSFVAILDIALVFVIFQGDVKIS
jgi:hypothetical protein